MANSVVRSAIFIGKVITSDLSQAIKVSVPKYNMDQKLKMYFKEKDEVYAFDHKKECSEGDYVIIRRISEDGVPCKGKRVEFDVEKLVYTQKAWVDPVSGKRTAGIEYMDNIRRTCEIFGQERPYFNDESK